MTDPFSAFIVNSFATAVDFVFSAAASSQFAQFVGASVLSLALQPDQPRLTDLRIQTSSYGSPIPRLYGRAVRVTGNVIDKSDLVPVVHKIGLTTPIGVDLGSKYYTYYAHLGILLCDGGMLKADGLKRIFANGRCIFDRDQAGATAGTANFRGVTDAFGWTRNNFTMAHIGTVALYPGSATQGVDPTLSSLYPGEDYPAYRHTCYVVLERFDLSDWGNRVPNLEFELEPLTDNLGDIVSDLASFAGVNVYTNRLTDTVRGYIVAQATSVWGAIEPLAAAFAFDVIATGPRFDAVKRGQYLRTVIPTEDLGARDVKDEPRSTKSVSLSAPSKLPDEVTITYLDATRDYQTNTQRAARTANDSENKVNVNVSLVLTDDEARNIAERTVYEGLTRGREIEFTLSNKYRWLKASDVVGLTVGGVIEPFRLLTMTRSPNGVIACEAVYEDPYLYQGVLIGTGGDNPPDQSASLPGDTVMQPMDAALISTSDDDTGFYTAFAGEGSAWHGAEIYRAPGVGSPLSFELIGGTGPVPAVMADCATTLPSGPTDVWDRVSTLTVTMIGPGTLESATEADVLVLNANLAWVGGTDGEDGEYINFATATAGSPAGTYILSNLLRGRFGTEFAAGAHGSSERLVIADNRIGRMDFGAIDWNQARTYESVSLPLQQGEGVQTVFTNTGEGKRPLSPVHLRGARDASNNLTLSWVRRTRFRPPAVGGGAVPLGEETEAYEVDIMHGSPLTVLRTIAASSAQVTYTAAQQTADGLTPGNPVSFRAYQMSGVYGRGRVASGRV